MLVRNKGSSFFLADERTGKKKKHPGRTTHREGDYEYVSIKILI